MNGSSMQNWLHKQYFVSTIAIRGQGEVGKGRKALTETEMELARVKRELAIAKMERDILKKAAAYFAKESLPGTRS
jgi:transposase